MCGAALLYEVLSAAGGRAEVVLPHRLRDGYGLSADSARRLAATAPAVVVTVDNGTSAIEGLAVLRAAGLATVVVDHHLPGATLPEVDAMVNPHVARGDYPFTELCGTGLAFKLAWATAVAVCGRRRLPGRVREALLAATGLVALASVADVVPLRDENRVLVAWGLRALEAARAPGVQALLRGARVRAPLLAEDLAFRLGPRLNAAGRMGDAQAAFELLTTRDPRRAELLARFLERENGRRRQCEAGILQEALGRIPAEGPGPVVCLADPGWHLGVVGIVCARLVERFGRPGLLLSISGDEARGSLRCPPEVHATRALAACAELLSAYGGHAAAAGLRLPAASVDAFAERFAEAVRAQLPEPQPPVLELACELPLGALGRGGWQSLARLEPCGAGNPAPLFGSGPARIEGVPYRSGPDGTGLSLSLRQGRRVLHGHGHRLGHLLPALVPDGVPLRAVEVAYRARSKPPVQRLDIIDVRRRCGDDLRHG